MIERKDHVRITNHLTKKIVGRYDGEDYEFLPSKPHDVPIIVAVHIFGFGQDDKVPALNRLGWLRTSEELDKAMANLNKVAFAESPPLVDAPDDFEEEDDEPETRNRLPAPSGATAPPVSPEASGGGAAGKTSALKPPGK